MMWHKSDLGESFIAFAYRFVNLVSNSIGIMTIPQDQVESFDYVASSTKKLHSDNEKEYNRLKIDLGGRVSKYYSPPYAPELNAIAERFDRTIEDSARSMIIKSNIPTSLWPFAVKHVVFVPNHVPNSTTNQTPYSIVTGSRLTLKNIRVFGCASYVLQLPQRSKLDTRSVEGVLLEFMNNGVYNVLAK